MWGFCKGRMRRSNSARAQILEQGTNGIQLDLTEGETSSLLVCLFQHCLTSRMKQCSAACLKNNYQCLLYSCLKSAVPLKVTFQLNSFIASHLSS